MNQTKYNYFGKMSLFVPARLVFESPGPEQNNDVIPPAKEGKEEEFLLRQDENLKKQYPDLNDHQRQQLLETFLKKIADKFTAYNSANVDEALERLRGAANSETALNWMVTTMTAQTVASTGLPELTNFLVKKGGVEGFYKWVSAKSKDLKLTYLRDYFDVAYLQGLLKMANQKDNNITDPGNINGEWEGTKTKDSLTSFQAFWNEKNKEQIKEGKIKALKPDGQFGPKTFDALQTYFLEENETFNQQKTKKQEEQEAVKKQKQANGAIPQTESAPPERLSEEKDFNPEEAKADARDMAEFNASVYRGITSRDNFKDKQMSQRINFFGSNPDVTKRAEVILKKFLTEYAGQNVTISLADFFKISEDRDEELNADFDNSDRYYEAAWNCLFSAPTLFTDSLDFSIKPKDKTIQIKDGKITVVNNVESESLWRTIRGKRAMGTLTTEITLNSGSLKKEYVFTPLATEKKAKAFRTPDPAVAIKGLEGK